MGLTIVVGRNFLTSIFLHEEGNFTRSRVVAVSHHSYSTVALSKVSCGGVYHFGIALTPISSNRLRLRAGYRSPSLSPVIYSLESHWSRKTCHIDRIFAHRLRREKSTGPVVFFFLFLPQQIALSSDGHPRNGSLNSTQHERRLRRPFDDAVEPEVPGTSANSRREVENWRRAMMPLSSLP